MSKDISVNWSRAGVQQTNDIIPMQVDHMSMQESAYYGGVAPYFRFNGYINTTQYAILYRDLLIDTTNIDPTTNQLTQYRVIAPPEFFVDGHVELILDRVVGS